MADENLIYELESHATIEDSDVLPISAAAIGDAEKVTISALKADIIAWVPAAPVTSVNWEVWVVVLDADNIAATTDKNYVTDAEKVVIWNTSGTNTWDMSDAEVKTAYENNADTNAYTDAEKVIVWNTSGTNTGDQDLSSLVTWPASSTDNGIARYDSTTWKIIQDSNNTIDDDGELSSKAIQLDTSYTPSVHAEGKIHWNVDDNTLEVWLAWDVSLQLWQEIMLPSSKAIGSNILNWQMVYLSGASGNKPEVSLAKADASATSKSTLAMATEDITQNTSWFCTSYWLVRDVDTSAFSEWDTLYLSAATAGMVTNVTPSDPNFIVKVWYVIRSHATEWIIFVNIQQRSNTAEHIKVVDSTDYYNATTVEWVLEELWEIHSRENGFDLRDWNNWELSFVDWTRVFTIDVASGDSDFYFRCSGKKITKTTAQTTTIPDVTWTYYVYFDNDWVLQNVILASLDLDQFYQHAIVWLVYWNATAWTWLVGNERHGVRMDSRTHHYNHATIWARYASGMNPTGLTSGSPTYTNTTSGVFWDEDIDHAVALATTHPFIYRLWATGEWTWIAADNEVWYKDWADTYYSWNEWTGATWQLTEWGPTSDYWITFFVATPDIWWQNIKKIIWQNSYATAWAAREAIYNEIAELNLWWLPSVEMVFLYAVIVQRDGNLVALDDGSTYLDLRTVKGTGWVSGTWDMTTGVYDPAGVSEQLVWLTATQTLSNKTLTTPVIANFTNMNHAHNGTSEWGKILGTDIDSTWETGWVKFLREDWDGTCSWQTWASWIAAVVDDTTPQLGWELDSQANSIWFTLQTATGDGTTTINWKLGNKFKFTFGAFNETFTFTAPSKTWAFQIIMVQDSTGSRTATRPATVKRPGWTAPTLSTAASSVDIISMIYDGTNYYATSSLNFS